MKKEELLIIRLKAIIKEWNLEIAEVDQKMDIVKNDEKQDYEEEIECLYNNIANAKKDIKKLEKS